MRESFAAVRAQAGEASRRGMSDHSQLLRQLGPRQRQLLVLFREQAIATAAEIAAHLGLSRRTVADLCRSWLTDGFLVLHDPSRKNRSYQLGPKLEQLVVDSLPRATDPALPPPFAPGFPSAA